MPAAAGTMRISTTLLVLASALLVPSYSEPAEVSTSVIAQARQRHVRINRQYVVRGYNASTSATTLSSYSSTSDSTADESQGHPSTVWSDTSTSAAVTATVTLSTVDSVISVNGPSSTSVRTTETEREPSSIRGSFPTPAPIVTATEPMSTSHAEEPSSSSLSTHVSFDIPSPEPIVTTTQSISTSQTKDPSSDASISTGSFEAPSPVTHSPSATATTPDAESSPRLSDDRSTTAFSGWPTFSGSSVLVVVQSSQSPKPVTSRSRVEESTFRASPVSAKKDIDLSLSLKISLSMSMETSSASALTSQPAPSSNVPYHISQSAKNGSFLAEQTQTSLAPTEAMPEGTSEATSSSTIGKTSFFPGSTSRLVTTTAVKPGSRSASGPSASPTDPVADPPQTTRQQMKKVGLTTGAVSASILCGIVVFFLSNWYRRRRELHVARPSTSLSSRTAFDTTGRNIVQRQISRPLHVQSSHNFFRA